MITRVIRNFIAMWVGGNSMICIQVVNADCLVYLNICTRKWLELLLVIQLDGSIVCNFIICSSCHFFGNFHNPIKACSMLKGGREEGIVKDGPRICCGTLLPLHVVVLLGNPLKFAAFSRCRRRPFRLHRIFEPMKAWPVKWRLCWTELVRW